MSRTKLARSVVDTCADCGAVGKQTNIFLIYLFIWRKLRFNLDSFSDPTWASINKGILICDECCSVHRTLGRHISHVKSLRKGSWVPSQLAVCLLYSLFSHLIIYKLLFLSFRWSMHFIAMGQTAFGSTLYWILQIVNLGGKNLRLVTLLSMLYIIYVQYILYFEQFKF